jgi:hypothetical protein
MGVGKPDVQMLGLTSRGSGRVNVSCPLHTQVARHFDTSLIWAVSPQDKEKNHADTSWINRIDWGGFVLEFGNASGFVWEGIP